MRFTHAALAVASVTIGLIAFACEAEPQRVANEVARVPKGGTTFNPRCGKAGDVVTVTAPAGDDLPCRSRSVRFHPGVSAAVTSVVPGGGGTCIMTATVPGPAVTGTVEVGEQIPSGVPGPDGEPAEQIYLSSDAFTIPCPPDAGDPDGAPTDGGSSGPPLNTIFLHRWFAGSTIANTETTTYPQGATDAQKAAIARREAIVKSELAPPGVPVGTCAPVDLPAPGPDLPSPVYRGPLTLKAGVGNVLNSLSCGPDFVYRAPYQLAPHDGISAWELFFGGNGAEQSFTVPDATEFIRALPITTPDPATPDVDVPQGPYTLVWNATLVKLMTVYLLRSSGAPMACAVDPLAGTFTIPANILGGPGDVTMRISGGDLRRLAIVQLAAAIMTMQVHNWEFTLHVQ